MGFKPAIVSHTFICVLVFWPGISTASIDDLQLQDEAIINTTVVTPARLTQKMKDVPAGVTVITGKRIKELGLSQLPEVMRLVPGMRLTQASGWDYRVNFHGTNGLIPRRMLLLVNGMAVHRYGFAEVDWNLIALDLEDIERIEVTRSPSSPSYGSNAFQQVVNIITKKPKDVADLSLLVEKGSNGLYRGYGRISGGIGSTDLMISFGRQGDNGFDLVEFDRAKPPAPGAVDGHDVERILFRSDTQFELANLELNIGGVKSTVEDEEVDSNQLAPPDRRQEDRHFQAIYNRTIADDHQLKIQASVKNDVFLETWDACNPTAVFVSELRDLADANSTLAWQLVRGQTPIPSNDREQRLLDATLARFAELGPELAVPICGTGNQDNETMKRVLEIEDTFAVNDAFQINTGIGYQDNYIDSETFSNGKVGSVHKYLFSNLEFLASEKFTVNAGFLYEDVSTVDEKAFAPRLGVNYHFTPGATLRVVYSTGKRMPNILETDGDWSYLVRNWDHEFDGRTEGKFFLTTRSPDGLQPESIRSFEMGVYGSLSLNRFNYDARIFKENLTDLISEKGEFFSFLLTNDNSVDMSGFEAEFKYRIHSDLELRGGYSYLESDATHIFEKTLYSKHQGFASVVYSKGLSSIALAAYGQSPVAGESYARTDIVFTRGFKLDKYNTMDLQITGSYFGFDQMGYQWRVDNTARHSYDESYAVKAKLAFYYH